MYSEFSIQDIFNSQYLFEIDVTTLVLRSLVELSIITIPARSLLSSEEAALTMPASLDTGTILFVEKQDIDLVS